MLEGSMTAKAFVDEIVEEIDVSLPHIRRKQYYDWINAELFNIYTSAVRCIGANEYKAKNLMIDLNNPYVSDDFEFDQDFDPEAALKPKWTNCDREIDTIMYEDVYKVYNTGNNEYQRSTLNSLMAKGKRFYYKLNGKLAVTLYETGGIYRVLFYIRPKKVTDENAESYIIPLPDGFLDVLRARVRMEAFMLAGNVAMANAWREQHMILFDTLKKWHKSREAHYIG